MTKVGFIGAGNMGTAIMKGILNSSLKENIELYAADPDISKTSSLEKLGVKICKDSGEVVSICKYVFLAVKPQVIEDVLKSVAGFVKPETVFVSIAAGISSCFIKSITGADTKSVIVMPNTPLLLNEGASALAKPEPVSDEEFGFVLEIFKACGKAEVISEDKMKEIIAVNGSSPAFIYLFAKGFIDYAVKEGISRETAVTLFSQSLIGSAKMITDSGYSLDELIKMVSSPGGTTLAGLDELYKGKLTDVVMNASEACTKRAYELAK
ncbi:MAG: pyrroline-5-carboxylate reductase [Porcipelethomonas sp.]